jgi:ATP phosphoribosyltransferase
MTWLLLRTQVSTGVTLRENNLKQIEGGRILDSQGVLVANRRALTEQPGLLAVVHELIERLEARLSFWALIS